MDRVKKEGKNLRLLEKANSLPKKSGCYLMKNKHEDIIYVGKAKNLKARVTSYFNQSEKSPKTIILVGHIIDFDFIVTNSDAESYVLENNLIKEHRPKYNIRLKDDKSYPYIQIDYSHDFPRLEYRRRPKKAKGIKLLGPFPTGSNISNLLRIVTKSFALRDCSNTEFKSRKEPCILYQMRQCSAPCVGKISKDDYGKDLDLALNIFKDKKRAESSVGILEERMFDYANREEFERAAFVRDNLSQVEEFLSQSFDQKVELGSNENADIISYYVGEEQIDISLYLIRHGNLLGHRSFYFSASDLIDELEEEVVRFLLQYYEQNESSGLNKIVMLLSGENQKNFQQAIDKLLDKKIKVSNKLGSYKALEHMAKTHAQEVQNVRLKNEESKFVGLNKLKDLLTLKDRPRVLECYDVAIWQGKSPTASQIVFHDGVADKKSYRYYSLEERPEGNNDFAMMQEVISRRIKYKNFPDVFIIDGGHGQVNSVIKVLKEHDIEIPVVGIAKAKDLKTGNPLDADKTDERLVIPGRSNPYILKKNMSLFRIVVQMRDEAHRFSRKLHHKKEKDRIFSSWVDSVKGINNEIRKQVLANQKLELTELKELNPIEIQAHFRLSDIRHANKIYEYLRSID